MDVGVKLVSRGRGSCSLSSTTSSSRRQCDGGGGSGLFSNCDSFISSVSCLLCQPPFWGCQSRPKLVPQEAEAAKAKGSCSHYWRRRIQKWLEYFLETKFSHAMDIRQEGKTEKVKFHHRPGDLEMACEKVSFLYDICNRRYFFYSVS